MGSRSDAPWGGPDAPAGGPDAPGGLVWLDGRLVSAAGPHLPVTDRGFQLGDGVFETLRARRGVPIEWEEHAARLAESAAALEIALPYDALELRGAVTDLLRATGLDGGADPRPGDAAVRITVSRGAVTARGILPPGWRELRATVVVQAWPHRPVAEALLARGLRVVTSSVRRDPGHPLAGVKTTSRAEHVYARLEAERAGVDDALLLTADGRLAEATSANIGLVEGGRLRTPSLGAGILAGTTRAWLLRDPAVRVLGLVAVEEDCWPADLARAEEAFLCSSVAGIVPLVEVDGQPIGDGRPGPRTLALRAAREAWIDAVSRAELDAAGARPRADVRTPPGPGA
ncbi:MAG TPA: aminotransferase class IV [Candidatus Binatia bacterium]|nr:aminotransferase class IV [Candidatus Binatia bacterium]